MSTLLDYICYISLHYSIKKCNKCESIQQEIKSYLACENWYENIQSQ